MEPTADESRTAAASNEVLAQRGHVLLALYEGALGFMRHAVAAQERRDLQRYAYFLDRAQGVIQELTRTLDHPQSPELANMLGQLYEFMTFQIGEARRNGRRRRRQGGGAEARGRIYGIRTGKW